MIGSTVISEDVAKGSQSWNYAKVVRFTVDGVDKLLRVEIKSDSYDAQSYARVKLWDGNQWNFVHNIPYANMASLGLAYVKGITTTNFWGDSDALVEHAIQVVFNRSLR